MPALWARWSAVPGTAVKFSSAFEGGTSNPCTAKAFMFEKVADLLCFSTFSPAVCWDGGTPAVVLD